MIKAELVNQTMTWRRAQHAQTNRNSRHVPLRAAKRLPVIFQRDRNIDGSRGMRILVIEDEFKAGVYLKSISNPCRARRWRRNGDEVYR
jgi:hypothetical protein